MDVEAIAKTFVDSYYQMFDTNRSGLGALYRPESQLRFETTSHQGPEAILKKLVELPFQMIQHSITLVDAQVTVDGGLIVMVVGQLKTDNDPIQSFSQAFYLKQIGDGLFVMNDIFRLNLHHAA